MNLVDAWYKKNPLLHLLQPLSGVYRIVVAMKTWAYRLKIRKTTYFPVKVIVVGNLTVGGTGKTPLVIALASYLQSQGYKPGIVSRGYGGVPQRIPKAVYSNSDPKEVGDETVLIARKTKCPIYVSPNRVAAAQTLLAAETCDVIISDDGLQHLALGRDVEIVVVDGKRYFGNGFCLPAGPLREPLKRLKSVDFLVVTQAEPEGAQLPNNAAKKHNMRLVTGEIYNLKNPALKLDFSDKGAIHAVAGIGNPSRFFADLRTLGLHIIPHTFPDHYAYRPEDIDFGSEALVIMTEKDAIKCERFIDARHWCLPVAADCGSMLKSIGDSLNLSKNV